MFNRLPLSSVRYSVAKHYFADQPTSFASTLRVSLCRTSIPVHGPNAVRTISSFARGHQSFALSKQDPPQDPPNLYHASGTPVTHEEIDEEHLRAIRAEHRNARTRSARVAYNLVRLLRWGTDTVTGYRHPAAGSKEPYTMTERKWLTRFIFLETVAGVPGMVAAMLRHFRSLRRMRRDLGWIETLLDDAHNERMHLLVFLQLAKPGLLMRATVLAAQGIFANGFFLVYFFASAAAHRFVAYLEEEAVKTYSVAISDVEGGKLLSWKTLQVPHIAVKYWNMPENARTVRDLLLYVRADEAKHSEIHRTLGNLDQAQDPNPFVSEYRTEYQARPSLGVSQLKQKGWERNEVV